MPSERGRILGIGGIFFKSANQQQMRECIGRHFRIADRRAISGNVGNDVLPWTAVEGAVAWTPRTTSR